MKKFVWIAAIAATLSATAIVGVFAHGGATGIVKERMDLMKVMGDSMKELTAMMRGKTDYDADKVRELASRIGEHSGDRMLSKFPQGSNNPPSEALPSIWSDWDQFVLLSNQMTDYAAALAKAADNDRPDHQGGMMQDNKGMMNNSGGMMQGNQGMKKGSGGMMMGNKRAGPSPEDLASMPPDAAFMHLARTCSDCHQDFRQKK